MNDFEQVSKFPLTHPQKRIWYIEKIYPGTALYNIGGPGRIKGIIDFEVFEKSINCFIRKNEGVRLRFAEADGEAFQYVSQYKYTKVDFFDFSDRQNQEDEFNKWMDSVIRKPFNLLNGPLYYFALYKITENESGYIAVFHHIISDGWSINILTNQLCDYYVKIMNNEDIDDELKPSYLNYIESEERYLSSDRFIRNKQYWNDKFKTLPANIIRGLNSTKGSRSTHILDRNKSLKIKEFVSENNCSVNTFFVSLMLIYLNISTQQKDIVIGTPVLNRSGKSEKGMFGMFTSTMPFRIELNTEWSVKELLHKTNNELKSCYFNQKYPYDILAQDLELKKKGYDGLFQMCVNYYNTKLDDNLDGKPIRSIELYNGCQLYSMQLVIKDWFDYEGMMLDLDYKTEDYSKEQIENLFVQLNNLIDYMLADPDEKIGNLTYLSLIEKNKLLYDYNSHYSNYPKNKTIYQLFEEQTEECPSKAAVCFNNKNISYEELNRRANQLAGFLRQQGAGRGSIVGLMVTHSFEMVIGILGILKSGGAYLPIDPDYPAERIDYIIKDSGLSVLLTNCSENKDIDFEGRVYSLNDESIYTGNTSNPEKCNTPDDLAYIIYTSGSTGKPKGVMIEHQGLLNYICWARKMYVRGSEDVFALYSSLSFDLTVTSVFTPLISGNTIVVYRDDGAEYVLFKILKDNRATVVKLTPAHLSLLKDMDNSNSAIKRFIVGGEDLKVSLAAAVHNSFKGDIEIYNEYGPTETVVGCMIYKYDYKKDKGISVPIGVPADNVQIYILNDYKQPCAMGVCGELYISGDGVARGYLNKPELTAEKFIKNPYIEGARMYKTGDLACYAEDGIITYMGRLDHQVKIHGYRIEPGEIEKQLLGIEYIRDAVVIDREDKDGGKYLCAYLQAEEASKIDAAGIRHHLAGLLPEYMIPLHFVSMDSIPLTPNGKVDRRLLPEPVQTDNEEVQFIAPQTEVEKKLASAIGEVLKIETISLKSNFLHLGGDSIKAIQISARLNELGMKLKVKDILSNPVIEDMVSCIESTCEAESADQTPVKGSVLPTPISAWFFSQNFNNINHWNQSVLIEIPQIEQERLNNIISSLIEHHDTLRLNYNGQSAELFYNEKYLEHCYVEVYDLSDYSSSEQDESIRDIGSRLKAGIDIENDILIKACAFYLGKNRELLLLTAHHLVTDGVSWRVLLKDITDLIEHYGEAGFILPPKTHSVQKWAEELNKSAAAVALKEESYWRNIISKDFTFPVDFDDGRDILENCKTLKCYLSEEQTKLLLTDANKVFSTNPGELMIIALAVAVSRFSAEKEVVLELEGHGREVLSDNVDISRTVGWFTSIYPVCLSVEKSDYTDLIKSLKEQLRSIPNSGAGFGISKYLAGFYSNYSEKLVRFNYLGDFDASFSPNIEFSDRDSGPDISNSNHMTCLIEINSIVVKKALSISLTFSTGKFKEETAERFIDLYKSELCSLVDYCSEKKEKEFTPSDFETIDMDQSDLDSLFM
jgi:amino acid adenylation domain-containing protein/non-ribosomal peptide synthase protein (TIGR01720 family)